MPNVNANGISIYYEIHPATGNDPNQPIANDKTPLLMIMGLGLNSLGWYKNVASLSSSRTVIVFDNRGTGRSSKPNQTYSIKQMAADTVALLDAIGVSRAHIFGYSMGSMIAQEVAINYPHKVKSLILGASTVGGLHAHLPSLGVGNIMLARGFMKARNGYDIVTPVLYSRDFRLNHANEIAPDAQKRSIYPTPAYVYRRQLIACTRHNTYNRLDQLQMPTLVFTGTADILIPPQNSRILARRIPRAELVLVPGRAHYLPSEDPQTMANIILGFLDHHFAKVNSLKAEAA